MGHTTDVLQIPLAITGMACRLPGARDIREFWQLLIDGKSAIAELPADRVDPNVYYSDSRGLPGRTYTKLAGTVSRERQEPTASGDSVETSVDESHLAMLEVARAACRHAGLDPSRMASRNAGVYIGYDWGSSRWADDVCQSQLEHIARLLSDVEGLQDLPPGERESLRRDFAAAMAARLPPQQTAVDEPAAHDVAGTIRRTMSLTGPSLAINSACASSLQALLVAARSLQLGQIEMAIVGGAATCRADTLIEFSKAQANSATGSRPFDAQADGVVCSEGYVAIVVKTLERAVADGDPIQAVVRGLGVSADGRSVSPWAPQSEGQALAIRRAYRAGVDMSRVQYIEAHATSTQRGDATELESLSRAFAGKLPPDKKFPITSVKANIGHTLEAAGMAGLVKTVLSMQHGMIPPAINVASPMAKLDSDDCLFYLPTQATAWPQPADAHPRRAGVNAFGLGGLNMHVVLDAYTPGAPPGIRRSPSDTVATGQVGIVKSDQPIAIIGRGCLLPGARGIGELTRLASATDLECRREVTSREFVEDYRYDWRRHKIPPKQVAGANPLDFLLLETVDQAMMEAGFDQRSADQARVGVIVGTEFGSDFSCDLQLGWRLAWYERVLAEVLSRRGLLPDQIECITSRFSERLLERWPAALDESGSFQHSAPASRIARSWDLMGGAATIDAGIESGVTALGLCRDLLLAGDCDMMICAAGRLRTNASAFKQHQMALDGPSTAVGAGALLLKRADDAVRDGDRVLGTVGEATAFSDSHRDPLGALLGLGAVLTETLAVDAVR